MKKMLVLFVLLFTVITVSNNNFAQDRGWTVAPTSATVTTNASATKVTVYGTDRVAKDMTVANLFTANFATYFDPSFSVSFNSSFASSLSAAFESSFASFFPSGSASFTANEFLDTVTVSGTTTSSLFMVSPIDSISSVDSTNIYSHVLSWHAITNAVVVSRADTANASTMSYAYIRVKK